MRQNRPVTARGYPLLVAASYLCGTLAIVWATENHRAQTPQAEEFLVAAHDAGSRGGQLVVTQRTEPRTLNPVMVADGPSREVIHRIIGDLIHINRETQRTETALAREWTVSSDGRRFTLMLRRGVRFSDGEPFDADDVVFSFQVYQDPKVDSPQRELLLVGGQPIRVRKIDQYTVQFDLAAPRAGAERLFDSVAMLPQHRLEQVYREGRLPEAWRLGTAASDIAGLGPFRFRQHLPGQYLALERNPNYWKIDRAGSRLPYLDQVMFVLVPNEDAQVMRFQAGEADVLSRIGAENFAVLERGQAGRGYTLKDLGPGLEYSFLFFNLNDLTTTRTEIAGKQRWFGNVAFRRAVSAAIDRNSIVRLVYRGRATPLAAHVPPGNRLWVNTQLRPPARSTARASELLRQAGFRMSADRQLVDARGQSVEFSILVNASNPVLNQAATLIQTDLREIGIRMRIVPFEFRAMLDRIFNTHDYEAALLTLGGGDADPNSELPVWLSSGPQHLWHLGQKNAATPWEAEIDRLMRDQIGMLDASARKHAYDRVQQIVADNLPFIFLVSPNVLVGARRDLGNFRPAVLDHQVLWNVDELFWRRPSSGPSR
jgi:peptide/nickel transport system substrate-binding protein